MDFSVCFEKDRGAREVTQDAEMHAPTSVQICISVLSFSPNSDTPVVRALVHRVPR